MDDANPLEEARRSLQEARTSLQRNSVKQRPAASVSAGRSTVTLDDATLLRGTSTSILLGGIGWRLRGSAGGIGIASADDEYTKSFLVKELEIFLSHSWHAWWLLKYLTLLFHFNAVPAVLSAACTGYFILAWQAWGVESCSDTVYWDCVEWERRTLWEFFHVSFLCLPAGGVVFFFVLFHWHYVAEMMKPLVGVVSIFLDKVCIHQTDPKRKEEGIKSIGAMLGNSRMVLVAWDKSYFERLWCTFEMAAFKYANPDSRIVVVPVMLGGSVATMVCLGCAAETLSAILSFCLRDTPFDISVGWRKTALYCVFYFPMANVLTCVFRKYGNDLVELDQQLSEFSVKKAKCFCCSNDHRIPGTGQVLQCDRELVNASIAYWHGGEATETCQNAKEIGLKKFDELIRISLRRDVKRTLGGLSQMPYSFALTVGLWDSLAWMDWSTSSKAPPLCRILISANAIFLLVPLTLAMVVWMTRLMASPTFGQKLQFECLRNRIVEFVLAFFATALTYLLRRICAKAIIRLDFLTVLWILAELCIVVVLYNKGLGYFLMEGTKKEERGFGKWQDPRNKLQAMTVVNALKKSPLQSKGPTQQIEMSDMKKTAQAFRRAASDKAAKREEAENSSAVQADKKAAEKKAEEVEEPDELDESKVQEW